MLPAIVADRIITIGRSAADASADERRVASTGAS